jgi:tyrosyl-tRNA synthetase
MVRNDLAADLAFRGLVHQVSDAGLLERLGREPMTCYQGFDPSADSLHVGSLLGLCTLRRLQLAGHRVIPLAGGGTGLIGDPADRAGERPLLTREQHEANMAGIRPQLERFLDLSGAPGAERGFLLDNLVWLGDLRLIEFLRDIGKHFSVNQMVQRDSIRSRFERPDQGISYTEFSYMLLQAYDFLYLYDHYDCRVQLGGSDQWGNIVAGVDLIRRVRGSEAFAITTPLVLKADGTKFGKSAGGAVWLDRTRTSPYELYQFFLRCEDAIVGTYLRYFTFLSHDEIRDLDAATAAHPEHREAQRALARSVCTLVHGEDATIQAERTAQLLFSEKIVQCDAPTLLEMLKSAPSTKRRREELDGDGLDLVGLLVDVGLVRSRSAARTAISQRGVSLNNRLVEDEGARLDSSDLIAERYAVLRRGRREHHLLCFD